MNTFNAMGNAAVQPSRRKPRGSQWFSCAEALLFVFVSDARSLTALRD